MKKTNLSDSLSKQNEYVYVRIGTSGPKRKLLLIGDLKEKLHELSAKSELYGEILISGDPIEYDEED